MTIHRVNPADAERPMRWLGGAGRNRALSARLTLPGLRGISSPQPRCWNSGWLAFSHARCPSRYSSTGRFERVLRSGRFAVTAELNPPDSADPEDVFEAARPLGEMADAIIGKMR